MKDLKTTIPGVIAALSMIARMFFPQAEALADPITAISVAIMGWNSAGTKGSGTLR